MPPALPLAPRPLPGELRTAWLRRVAAANAVSFAELLDSLAMVLPETIPAQVWLDDTLSPSVCATLAAWCRLTPGEVAALDFSRRYPLAAVEAWRPRSTISVRSSGVVTSTAPPSSRTIYPNEPGNIHVCAFAITSARPG